MFRNHFNTEALGKYRSQSSVWRRNTFGQNESSYRSKHFSQCRRLVNFRHIYALQAIRRYWQSSIFMFKVCWRSMCACEVHMTKDPALLQSCGQWQQSRDAEKWERFRKWSHPLWPGVCRNRGQRDNKMGMTLHLEPVSEVSTLEVSVRHHRVCRQRVTSTLGA